MGGKNVEPGHHRRARRVEPDVVEVDLRAVIQPVDEPPAGPRQPTPPLDRERERFLAAVVESAGDAIFAKALDGTILSWNLGAQRMYGYTPEEIVGTTVHRLAPIDHRAEIDSILERVRAGLRVEPFETERVRKNGQRFPVSLAISPVADGSGRIIGASTVARDISEQRRLLESVRFQQSLLTAESEASIDGIIVVDPDGRVLYTNSRFLEIWGLTPNDPLLAAESSLLEALGEQVVDAKSLIEGVETLNARPTERGRDEIRLRDGRVLDRYGAPVFGEARYYGRVWYYRDVTADSVRMAQLRAVIMAVEDGAIVFDSSGRVLLRNPAANRALPEVERYDQLLSLLGHERTGSPDDAGATDGERQIIVDGEAHSLVVSTRRIALTDADEGRPTPGIGQPHLGWLVLVRDLTELRAVQTSREAFVGVLSHELRTPITTIYAASKMLQRDQAPGTRAELLADIEAESDRLYRLVEDLLVLTRIERENLEIADQPVLVGPIVRRVIAAERSRNPKANVSLRVEPALPMARGEDTYVEQVIRNLVGNAIKYGPPSGLVEVIAEPGERGVRVRVLDDGPGIAVQDGDRVFELLYRSPATAAQAAGSGIGLFVSRRLADAMGGGIIAKRRPEGGTEFIFELPAYDEEADG
jgi:PAS domain S-box-containing protein